MKNIILKVLKEFRDTDLTEIDIDDLIEKFNNMRNDEFFLKKFNNIFADWEAYFYIYESDCSKSRLYLCFSAYAPDGDLIYELSIHDDSYPKTYLQELNDDELEKFADYLQYFVERRKEIAKWYYIKKNF